MSVFGPGKFKKKELTGSTCREKRNTYALKIMSAWVAVTERNNWPEQRLVRLLQWSHIGRPSNTHVAL